jgi:hypothetical protein
MNGARSGRERPLCVEALPGLESMRASPSPSIIPALESMRHPRGGEGEGRGGAEGREGRGG